MMVKLAASVVWSINATRSTLAQARKIFGYQALVGKRIRYIDHGEPTVMIFLFGT